MGLASVAASAAPVYLPQGAAWTQQARDAFYVGDQGSQMIPLAWMRALQQQNGDPFLAGSLSRYGYLPNPAPGHPADLPVGFTVAPSSAGPMLGMTCSACHTREINVAGQAYRVDGGPAVADFQSLLADLDQAVSNVLASSGSFTTFAQTVLGTTTPDPASVAVLRADVTVWSTRFHVLMSRALPKTPWGPSRLDAVSMIYDRLTGLDLGPAPTYLIPSNIMVADAPTRYPFLWNSPIQSQTQWPGFADNGSDLFGLSRNLGEVYGVFGTFHPKPADHFWDVINRHYNKDNSANYGGLIALETLVKKIGPPEWPRSWPLDAKMAEAGRAIFNRPAPEGCVECHGQAPGPIRLGIKPLLNATWKTPVQDVGTDTHESDLLARPADSGSLAGASIPGLTGALCQKDYAFNILATSVLGGIIQYYVPILAAAAPESRPAQASMSGASADLGAEGRVAETMQLGGDSVATLTSLSTPQVFALRSAFHKPANQPPCTIPAPTHQYESRVLYGIWAAAPYLHNGSVPTLAELLKPAAQRVPSFKIGPAYDPVNVGLAKEQTAFNYTLVTTGCGNLSSGNSNCGHEYGTMLSDGEKKQLLEYLKVIKPGT